jgi:nicotinamidase-related amidase
MTTTALVFQGVQNDFCHPSGRLYSLLGAQLQQRGTLTALRRLVEGFLDRRAPVFFVPIEFTSDYREITRAEGVLGLIRDQRALSRGSVGAAPLESFLPLLERATVVQAKRGLCAFGTTPLHDLLQRAGVTTVVVAGLLTNVCVETTARSAYDLGYRVVMVPEATATRTDDEQRASERYAFPLLGTSLDVSTALAQLDAAL